MTNASIELVVSPREFFHDKITTASRQLNVKLEDHVEFYLVNLLTSFVTSTTASVDGNQAEANFSTPLVFLLKRAVEAPVEKQPALYRQLGDTSLYVSGFFQDYFNNKAIDINYFISMGASAYRQAGTLAKGQARDDSLQETFQSLSENFNQAVEIVAQASDSTAMEKNEDLLVLYDRWNRSGSERLRLLLEEQGIQPIKVPYKQAQ
jgi:hypothetical protein